ncbi:MAG: hypothetical protein II126_02530, partial [Erysipelotrichaceae bacterium]|nr:hypothetical protein [Erysipelotrichaceae bacterium]
RKEVEITRTATVSYPRITGTLNADDIPHSVEIPVFKDGRQQNMEAELLEINKTHKERWISDLQIDGVFEGNEHTEYFLLPNGEELNIDSEKPLWEGFSNDILSDRGLPLKYYELTDGKWIDRYHQKGDLWQRNAVYTGRRLAADYEAVYQLTYKTLGYSGKVIYRKVVEKDEVSSEQRKTVYTIKAIVRYRLLGEE